ncbi:unnamed protein product [Staurois parvus]|uniref:Uncharacterized protein n=1 Tax=Staurois parvus TaxID=386267 RepID=A0ABN9BY02_9NEOB|nr:unnamed protein product [Staurois parvus]
MHFILTADHILHTDPVFSDYPLFLLSPIHLLIVQSSWSHSEHAQFSVYS